MKKDYANEHPLPEGLPQEVKIDVISLRNLNHENNTLRTRNAELLAALGAILGHSTYGRIGAHTDEERYNIIADLARAAIAKAQ
jgi:hypothetical protein